MNRIENAVAEIDRVQEDKKLTAHERDVLRHCEETISHHLETFKEAGSALLKIRDQRLYRENYVSFDEYCRAKWDMTKTQANRLIAASKVSEDLAKTLPKDAQPALEHLTESAVRPLVMLEPRQAVRVMRQVIREVPTERAITAAHVTQVARKVAPQAFQKRAIKPDGGGRGKKQKADLVRRSEVLAAITKWAKSKDLNKLTAKEAVQGIKQAIRSI